MLIIERVVRALANPPEAHDIELPEEAKRVRHGRLRCAENAGEVTHAELLVRECEDDLEPRGIAEQLERICKIENSRCRLEIAGCATNFQLVDELNFASGAHRLRSGIPCGMLAGRMNRHSYVL